MSKPEAEESANRLWWWIALYGHTKQPEFIADLKTVLEHAFPEQPQPAEDPDEWVIQDLVPVRQDLDRISWHGNSAACCIRPEVGGPSTGKKHGDPYPDQHPVNRHLKLYVMCRRRDLPKVECKPTSDGGINWSYYEKQKPQPQKTRVRLWKNAYGSVMSNPDCENIEGWQEIHHDSEGFYVEGQQ